MSVHFRHVAPDQHEAVAGRGPRGSGLVEPSVRFDHRPHGARHPPAGVLAQGRSGEVDRGPCRQPDALVMFVGGDPTDEDAFAALPKGVTVRVGPGTGNRRQVSSRRAGRGAEVPGVAPGPDPSPRPRQVA